MRDPLKRIILPEGEYQICDPCYILDNNAYDRLMGHAVSDRNGRECGFHMSDNGMAALGFFTAYGDGEYPGMGSMGKGLPFGVDSGLIGIAEEGLCGGFHGGGSACVRMSGPVLAELGENGLMEFTESDMSGRPRSGGAWLSVHTDPEMTLSPGEKYYNTVLCWIADHVQDDEFIQTFREYSEGWRKGDIRCDFEDWASENGLGGHIWPDWREAAANGQLTWERPSGTSRIALLCAEYSCFEENPLHHFLSHIDWCARHAENGEEDLWRPIESEISGPQA